MPNVFRNVQPDNRRYDDLFASMQRFRGGIYQADGAIEPSDLTDDGRHRVPIDSESWHVLSLDCDGNVVACLRYLDESYASSFHKLWVKHAAVSTCPIFGVPFRRAVEDGMLRAHRQGMGFGEVGGWAVAQDYRWTLEPLRIILATYGLLELLGGCAGVATATFRHRSAMILRRIGLAPIVADGEELPPYYDPGYRCQMQVLRFDSRNPAEKYRDSIQALAGTLTQAPVVCREKVATQGEGTFRGFELPLRPHLVPAML